MFSRINTNQDWLDRLLPENPLVTFSTIISGSDDSGKPWPEVIKFWTNIRRSSPYRDDLRQYSLLVIVPSGIRFSSWKDWPKILGNQIN